MLNQLLSCYQQSSVFHFLPSKIYRFCTCTIYRFMEPCFHLHITLAYVNHSNIKPNHIFMRNATTKSFSNRMIIEPKKIPRNYRTIKELFTFSQNLIMHGIKMSHIKLSFTIDRLLLLLLTHLKWTIFYLPNQESAFVVFPEFLTQTTLFKVTKN